MPMRSHAGRWCRSTKRCARTTPIRKQPLTLISERAPREEAAERRALDQAVEAVARLAPRRRRARRRGRLACRLLGFGRSHQPFSAVEGGLHRRAARDRYEPRRDEHRHHVEPDVAGRDAGRRVAVRDAEPGQLARPAPRADRRPVQLERGDDEEDAGVRRARTRAPEEDAEQRDADRAGDVEARQHGRARRRPSRRAPAAATATSTRARTSRRARARSGRRSRAPAG